MNGFTSFILLFGSLESFLLAILFFNYRGEKKLNRILSFLFLVFSGEFLHSQFLSAQWYNDAPWFLPLDTVLNLIQNPLIFFYSLYLCKKESLINKRFVMKHFIPVFLYLIFCLPFWLMGRKGLNDFLSQGSIYGVLLLSFDFIVIPIQFILYYKVMISNLNGLKERLKEWYSHIDKKRMIWFKTLISFMVTLYVLSFLLIFMDIVFLVHVPSEILYLPLFLFFLIFIQIITYKMLIHPDMLLGNELSGKRTSLPLSNKEMEEVSKIGKIIEEYMIQEEAYLDPDLNLKDLADQLDLSLHSVSKAINSHFNKNFFDYVNQYRVEYVKKMFRNQRNLNILEAAFEGGFNSKSSFNRIFKKHTGLTPSEYRKTQDHDLVNKI